MANLKVSPSGSIAAHYRGLPDHAGDRPQRSLTFGKLREDGTVIVHRDKLAECWDTALALGRATQGRRQGKPLPKAEPMHPPEPEHLSVCGAIDALLDSLLDQGVPASTLSGTRSNLKMLVKALGAEWPKWMTGYYRALAAVPNKNTRASRSRAANKLATFHGSRIPDFRKKTDENAVPAKMMKDLRRDKRVSKGKTVKPYYPEEAAPMLAALPGLEGFAEYMRLMELVACYMGMHRADSFNFLTLTTPAGAEQTRIDWERQTYYGCRQKSSSYFENVPIPEVVMEAIRPYRKGVKLVYPFAFPNSPDQYRTMHERLEQAAGVTHIHGRSISGWRHHYISTLSCELGVSDVVIKSLVAQETLENEQVAAVAGRAEDGDVINTYLHAWPAALRAASVAFEAHMARLIAEGPGENGDAETGVA